MKRFAAVFLSLALLFLCACTDKNTDSAQAPEPSAAPSPSSEPTPAPTPTPTPTPAPTPTPEPTPEPTPATFTMCILGDVLAHNTQLTDAYDASTGTYDFTHCYRYIKDHVSKADIAFAQLETTFAGGPNYATYPTFNTPDAMADALAGAGVDILGLAGNHVLDFGYNGLVRTLETAKAAGLTTVGAWATQEDRDENGILLMDINGISVAFLTYTYGTNGIPLPKDKEFVTSLLYTDYLTTLSNLNEEQILADLEKAKAMEPDLIIAITHWGSEYHTSPTSHQEKAAQFMFENGVDVILGSHPHVPEPHERRTVTTVDGEEKDVFVSFSLGNLISAQNYDYTNLSAMLDLEFSKDPYTGEVTLENVSYVPIYTVKSSEGGDYHVLPIHDGIDNYESGDENAVSQTLYSRLVKGLEDLHNILGKDGDSYYHE